jgi:hypothetical protein
MDCLEYHELEINDDVGHCADNRQGLNVQMPVSQCGRKARVCDFLANTANVNTKYQRSPNNMSSEVNQETQDSYKLLLHIHSARRDSHPTRFTTHPVFKCSSAATPNHLTWSLFKPCPVGSDTRWSLDVAIRITRHNVLPKHFRLLNLQEITRSAVY